ncbi:MAG: nitroreductase [Burkholderiaceae bacterium]|jgi:nitroreductase
MTLDPRAFDDLVRSRNSVRAFTSQPVPRELISEILAIASRAPSGTNTQPWQVYVLQGASRDALADKVCAAHDALAADPSLASQFQDSYDYYPTKWFDPYLARRRENGWGLYGVLGIQRGEKEKMHAQHQRNFRFFDAPVGLMFTVDRGLGRGSLMDYGMFLQNVMLAARSRGLDTCPQAAWTNYASIVMPHIGAGEHEMLICGMSLGWADHSDKVNTFITPREPVESFTHWCE